MIQILCAFQWDDVVRSVIWVDGDGTVMWRILSLDGQVFQQASSEASLRHVWALESTYLCFRPVLVATLQEGFWLLGNNVSVLDQYPAGDLDAPTHEWKRHQ